MKEKATKKATKKDKYKNFVDLMCKLYYGCLCAYGEKDAKKIFLDILNLLDSNKIKEFQCANQKN